MKYHAPVPAAGVADAVGTADAVGATLAAAGWTLAEVSGAATPSVVAGGVVAASSSAAGVAMVDSSGAGVDSGALVAGVALAAGSARPVLGERMATAEPPLEAWADGLAAERARAGPAVPFARLDFAEGPELLPALPADCAEDPESVEPPSVVAEATP